MAEEPQTPASPQPTPPPPSQATASGAASVAIGGNVTGSTIEIHAEIHNAASAPTPAPQPPHRLRSIPFPPMGARFTGREQLLAVLTRFFEPVSAAPAGARRAAGVKSDGGVGKTVLAVELGHRLFATEKFDYVLLLNASSAAALDLDLSALCAREKLNLPEQSAQGQATRLAGVLAFLAAPENAARSLLILDGVDSADAAQRVRQLHAELVDCALLATARQSIGGDLQEFRLDYFSPAESHAFLRSRLAAPAGADPALNAPEVAAPALDAPAATDPVLDAAAGAAPALDAPLDRVAEALDHYPLALELAASQMSEQHQSPQEWLDEWKSGETEFYRYYDPARTSYPVPLLRVWERTFARLSVDTQEVLHVLAWLAPRPAGLPLAPLKAREDWPQPRKALVELEKASLIHWTRDESDAGEAITVHRVLQAVVRAGMTSEHKEKSHATAFALLNVIVPAWEYAPEGWRLWERFSPHIRVLLTSVDDLAHPPKAFPLAEQFALWLHARAQYAESQSLQRRLLATAEKRDGADSPEITSRLNNLAQSLQVTGGYTEAEPLMRRALAIDEKSLGPEHPTVSIRLNNLAQLLKITGRPAEAEPLFLRALAIDEKKLGPEHPNVAIRLNNLAGVLEATSRPDEAATHLRRALAIDEKHFGPEHPEVARVLGNLAGVLKNAGHPDEAEPLMRRALTITEKSLGPDHPDVAVRRNNLGQLLQDAGRLDEAEPLIRRALAIDEKSLGPEHPNVAIRLSNLATLLQDTGRKGEAEPLIRRALTIDEKSLGAEHPSVSIGLTNLASLLVATGRRAEAEPLVRRALAIMLRAQVRAGHPLQNIAKFEVNYRAFLQSQDWPADRIEAHIAEMQREAATPGEKLIV